MFWIKKNKVMKFLLRSIWRQTFKPWVLRRRTLQYNWLMKKIKAGRILYEMPQLGHSFFMSIRSDIFKRQFIEHQYEPTELAALTEIAEAGTGDFMDIGANVGIFTVGIGEIFLKNGGKVLAVEPQPPAFEMLELNANIAFSKNGKENVFLHLGGLADDEGELEFFSIPGKEEYGSFSPIVHPAVVGMEQSREKLPVLKGDRLVKEFGIKPSLIKIDTEGFEAKVLRGLRETLEEFCPCLIFEANTTEDLTEILNVLRVFDYKIVKMSHHGVSEVLAPPGNFLAKPNM